MSDSTIKVVGTGSIHVVPDVTRLQVEISRVFKTYNDAYACAKENSTWMVRILEYNKQPGGLAKNIHLDISDNMVNEYSDGHYVGQKKDGILLTQNIKIDVGMDNALVNNIVRGVGKFIDGAQISIGYTQRDPRPTQLKMLARAVKDAHEKASIMAEAAGRQLGDVQNIEYGKKSLQIYSQAREIHSNHEASCSTPNSLDITPDDLVISDEVHVVWELK
ncbi:MAG: SIMPL domain-containing protein [Bacteroidales bacterium]|nr:SIMPL domain-containing protein [Bacteroidales bacterium]